MIEAEIKGKTGNLRDSEDVLTSTVFGLLKYKAFQAILCGFFQKAVPYNKNTIAKQLSIDKLETEEIQLKFWYYDSEFGEPDLIIKGNSFVILIEIKYLAEMSGIDQLTKYNSLLGKKYNNIQNKAILYLTMDLMMPSLDEKSTEGIEDKLFWLSWYELLPLVEDCKSENTLEVELIEDLKKYLIKRNLNTFKRFSIYNIDKKEKYFWNDPQILFSDYSEIKHLKNMFWRQSNE